MRVCLTGVSFFFALCFTRTVPAPVCDMRYTVSYVDDRDHFIMLLCSFVWPNLNWLRTSRAAAAVAALHVCMYVPYANVKGMRSIQLQSANTAKKIVRTIRANVHCCV